MEALVKLPLRLALALALTALMVPPALAQAPPGDGYVLPPAPVQELFDRDKNIATLDRLSPDGDHFLIPLTQELSNLETMSERTLRLAMLEFTPRSNREWNLSTNGDYGLSIYSLKARRAWPGVCLNRRRGAASGRRRSDSTSLSPTLTPSSERNKRLMIISPRSKFSPPSPIT